MRLSAALLVGLAPLCLLMLQAKAHEDVIAEEKETSYSTLPGLSWLQELTAGSMQVHSRKKRFVPLPKGSNMEVKWSINLPFDTFTDYKSKFQFALPIKIPFPDAIVASRRFDNQEYQYPAYQQQYYEANNDPEWHSRKKRAARQERSSIYSTLEGAMTKAGGHGRHCILRAICDVAEAPFEQGLLGEIINALLTASVAGRPENATEIAEYDHYIEAELHGKLNGKCEQRYNKCKVSPFDLLPQLIQTFQ